MYTKSFTDAFSSSQHLHFIHCNFLEQSVAWLTWGPSHLSTNCFVLPGRISQYPSGPDTVPVCRRDIQRDSAGLSSRDRQKDGGETLYDYCVGTLTTCWCAFPSNSTLCKPRLKTFSLSAPPVQLSYSLRKGKKRGKIKKGQRLRSLCMSSGHLTQQMSGSPSIHMGDLNSHQHERVHTVLCWQIPLGWLMTQPLMTEECRQTGAMLLQRSKPGTEGGPCIIHCTEILLISLHTVTLITLTNTISSITEIL